MLTADHGCDPSDVSTDHTREHVPLLVCRAQRAPRHGPGRAGDRSRTWARRWPTTSDLPPLCRRHARSWAASRPKGPPRQVLDNASERARIERLSARPMLLINVSKIPPEGQSIDTRPSTREKSISRARTASRLKGGQAPLPSSSGATTRHVHVRGRLAAEVGLAVRPLPGAVRAGASSRSWTSSTCRTRPARNRKRRTRSSCPTGTWWSRTTSGDRLDLGDVIREQLFLAVPLSRLCREDCQGLCPTLRRQPQPDSSAPARPREPSLSPFAALRGKLDGSEP